MSIEYRHTPDDPVFTSRDLDFENQVLLVEHFKAFVVNALPLDEPNFDYTVWQTLCFRELRRTLTQQTPPDWQQIRLKLIQQLQNS